MKKMKIKSEPEAILGQQIAAAIASTSETVTEILSLLTPSPVKRAYEIATPIIVEGTKWANVIWLATAFVRSFAIYSRSRPSEFSVCEVAVVSVLSTFKIMAEDIAAKKAPKDILFLNILSAYVQGLFTITSIIQAIVAAIYGFVVMVLSFLVRPFQRTRAAGAVALPSSPTSVASNTGPKPPQPFPPSSGPNRRSFPPPDHHERNPELRLRRRHGYPEIVTYAAHAKGADDFVPDMRAARRTIVAASLAMAMREDQEEAFGTEFPILATHWPEYVS